MTSDFFAMLRKARKKDIYSRKEQEARLAATQEKYKRRATERQKQIESTPAWKKKERERKKFQRQVARTPKKKIEAPDKTSTTYPTKTTEARFPSEKPSTYQDPIRTEKEMQKQIARLEKIVNRYPKSEAFYSNKIKELQQHFSETSAMDSGEMKSAQEKKEGIQAETLEESNQYKKVKRNFLDSWIAYEERKLTDPKWKGKHKEQEWGSANPRHRTEKEKVLNEKRDNFVFSGEEKDNVTFTVKKTFPAGIDYRPSKEYVGTKVPEEIKEMTVSSLSIYKKLEAWFEDNKASRISVIDKVILDGIERKRRRGSRENTKGLRRDKSFKQNLKKLKKLKEYSKVLEAKRKLNTLKSRYIKPKKIDIPKETQENSYYDWMLKYLGMDGERQLKQVRKDLLKYNISLDEVKNTWQGAKNYHKTIISKINSVSKLSSVMEFNTERQEQGQPTEKQELEQIAKTLQELMSKASKIELSQGESKQSMASKSKDVILRDMLRAKVRGDPYNPAYKMLIQSYLKGGKLEAYLNAIRRIKNKKKSKTGHQLKGLGLNAKEKELLYETTYGDNREGWRILAEIFKEKGIYVPKTYSGSTTESWSKIEAAGTATKELTNDMNELNRVLASADPTDDVDYITGEDSHAHIQNLLYITERNYKNMEDGEEKDDIGIFYGKLAYIAKFINDNMEPKRNLRISSSMLQDQNMSYFTLEEHFGKILSERVKTILENPENWGAALANKEQQIIDEQQKRVGQSAERYREMVGSVEDWVENMRQSVGTETYVDKETGEEKFLHRFQTKEDAEKAVKKLTDALERNKERRESERYDRASQHYGVYDFKDLPIEGLQELDPETLDIMGTWLEEQMWNRKMREKDSAELRERTAGQPSKIPHDGRYITREEYKKLTGKEYKRPFQPEPRQEKEKTGRELIPTLNQPTGRKRKDVK